MATLKELRDAANTWAAQEKADIEAGRKTPPMTSKEKIMSTKSFNDLGELSDLDQDNLYTTTKDQARELREGVENRRSARRGARKLAERAQAKKAGVPATPSARSDEHWKYATESAEGRAQARSDVLTEKRQTFNSSPLAGEVFNQGAEAEVHLGATGSNPLPPRTTKMATIKSQETVNFSLIEDTGASTKAQGLKHRALTRALRERRAALRGDPIKANQVQALSGEEKAAVDAAAKAEVERVRADVKARKEATVKARTITDEELFSGQSRVPIGQGKKDLGRSVIRTIRSGQTGDTELLKIAKKRTVTGRSVAGPDPAKPPTMAQRVKAAKAAGKLGGRLGMYGAIKGAFEGAETLRKLKTGAYDMTVEGGAKLKKGHVES